MSIETLWRRQSAPVIFSTTNRIFLDPGARAKQSLLTYYRKAGHTTLVKYSSDLSRRFGFFEDYFSQMSAETFFSNYINLQSGNGFKFLLDTDEIKKIPARCQINQ